jgi:hypothetical protein
VSIAHSSTILPKVSDVTCLLFGDRSSWLDIECYFFRLSFGFLIVTYTLLTVLVVNGSSASLSFVFVCERDKSSGCHHLPAGLSSVGTHLVVTIEEGRAASKSPH